MARRRANGRLNGLRKDRSACGPWRALSQLSRRQERLLFASNWASAAPTGMPGINREFKPQRQAVSRTISLLVPLFNSSRYLDQLKRDIDRQTRPFDEVIMHDDGSTDDTIKRAAELGFRVIRGGPKKRQSHARNRLLRVASCDFVHFHDHDDPIHPQFVERMLTACARDGVTLCHFAKTTPSERIVFGHDFENDYNLVFNNLSISMQWFSANNSRNPCPASTKT